ncbi:hypothetical protein NUW54_g12934 [Trametes sanguinea]|uniref:Uncharacterized protein n=1 Tax=Trametes sanguinea TaxID=158606 RepID=A0ACC1MRB4_9APHY|nr:hypothetical protein NUW54_g12934 [Trametes sanguinea]
MGAQGGGHEARRRGGLPRVYSGRSHNCQSDALISGVNTARSVLTRARPHRAYNHRYESRSAGLSSGHRHAERERGGALIEEVRDSDEEEDAFRHLGKLADQAEAEERRKLEAAEEAARKEKKRKRRESKAQDGAADGEEKKSKKKKKS